MTTWKVAAIGIAAGLVGVLVALVGWHAYEDHRLIDAIRADFARAQIQAKQAGAK